MTREFTYITREQIEEYLPKIYATLITFDITTLSEDDIAFNENLGDVEQFDVEIYVYCSKSDDESDYQWWDSHLAELGSLDGVETDNVIFTIYPDDENNPEDSKDYLEELYELFGNPDAKN